MALAEAKCSQQATGKSATSGQQGCRRSHLHSNNNRSGQRNQYSFGGTNGWRAREFRTHSASGTSVLALVPKMSSKHTILEDLTDEKWVEDIQGENRLAALLQYLNLCDILITIELHEDIPDRHIWLSSSGEYTAKTPYDALFQRAISYEPYERIWNSWTPTQMQILRGWSLITDAGLLTCSQRRGSPSSRPLPIV